MEQGCPKVLWQRAITVILGCFVNHTWEITVSCIPAVWLLLYLYSKYLIIEALEGLGDFKVEKAIHTLKYAEDLGLLVKEETVLQGIFDRTIEIRICYCYCWCFY
jgi:hypothetical protein